MPSKQRKNPGAHRRTRAAWPLRGARYLSTPNISPASVSSGASVQTLRGALGLDPGGFDGTVREAVMAAQDRLGLPVTGVVTEADWHAIVNPDRKGPRKRRLAPPAGGVDGADKSDSAAVLDAPQGAE